MNDIITKYTTVTEDLQTIQDLFDDMELEELCAKMNISETDFLSIKNGESDPTRDQLDGIYNFAYNNGLYLNEITWQESQDEYTSENVILGSHGSRKMITSNIRLDASRPGDANDFGSGFYIGQSIAQAGMFTCTEPEANLYIFTFDTTGLKKAYFSVSIDWMLAICLFRQQIPEYEDHPRIQAIQKKVDNCDYVLAPIADNKLFEVIEAFKNKQITDVQCLYALSSTYIGLQYVLKTQKALDNLELKEHLYYCTIEKMLYNQRANTESNISMYKAIIARKKHSGEGKYIDEILN